MIYNVLKYEPGAKPITITNKQFGEIVVDPQKQIYFPAGIIGIPNCRTFCLSAISNPKFQNFTLLQGIENINLSFLTLPIALNNHIVDMEDIASACGLLSINLQDAAVLLIASTKFIDGQKRIIVNARAPVFIDSAQKVGTQYVIPNTKYDIQYPL